MHTFETKHPVAHDADEMYALVADVEKYPQFLPLCEGLKVIRRESIGGKEVLTAKMDVGYKLIRESFTSKVTLDPARREILVEYIDGPFHHLENRWRFVPREGGGSVIDFFISYAFRSRLFERVMGGLFDKAVLKYTDAFEARADKVYGRKPVALTA